MNTIENTIKSSEKNVTTSIRDTASTIENKIPSIETEVSSPAPSGNRFTQFFSNIPFGLLFNTIIFFIWNNLFKVIFLIILIVLFSSLGINIFKVIWKFIIGLFSSFFGLFYKSKKPETTKTPTDSDSASDSDSENGSDDESSVKKTKSSNSIFNVDNAIKQLDKKIDSIKGVKKSMNINSSDNDVDADDTNDTGDSTANNIDDVVSVQDLDNYVDDTTDDPVPIVSESNVTLNKKGFCYIGTENGIRACAPVGVNNKCMSGDIFPSREICMDPALRE